MLALPGSAYLYQGEELGLPEAIDLPDESRQDPTWFRTDGRALRPRRLPRAAALGVRDRAAFGFNATGASWLPQPADWSTYARDEQRGVAGSTLELYTLALRLRSRPRSRIGHASTWLDGFGPDVVAFRNGASPSWRTRATSRSSCRSAEVLLATMVVEGPALPPNATVWLRDRLTCGPTGRPGRVSPWGSAVVTRPRRQRTCAAGGVSRFMTWRRSAVRRRERASGGQASCWP